ncbi:MAG: DUF4234 domain-containing protein [Candidatus Babeliales bacterium]|nr:DUF4234 domain-containing protein [Candidatus Babeliales bacterium]
MAIKYRSIVSIAFLNIITCGFYQVYWTFKTTKEMDQLGADLPTAFLMFVPFLNFYFYYKYSDGFAKFVKRDNYTIIYFILAILPILFGLNRLVFFTGFFSYAVLGWFQALLISLIPMIVFQSGLNQLITENINRSR